MLTPEERRALLAEAASNDGTTPLVFRVVPGLVHAGCGGDIEKANPPNMGTHCLKCSRMIPSEDVESRA